MRLVMTERSRLLLSVLLAGILLCPGPANAVSQAGAIVDTFSPSARGMAMAHTGGVVPEGPFALRWNPAGLALDQPTSIGVTYNELAAGFAEGIWILHLGGTVKFGAFGLGVYFARIDAGDQESGGTGQEPTSSGSHEDALRIGGAVDVFDLFDVDTGSNQIDLTIGAGVKHLGVEYAPASVTQDLGSGSPGVEADAWTMDAGALFRFGRFVDLGSTGSPSPSYLGMRASIAYDNLVESDLEFEDADQSDPLPSRLRYGLAFEAKLFPNPTVGDLLQVILAYERLDSRVEDGDTVFNGVGLEIAVANTLILRGGSHEDELGDIVGGTYGAGLRIAPGSWSWGVQLDYANRPQATGLDRIHMFTVGVGYDLFE